MLLGPIVIGIIIGQFSSHMEHITQQEKQKTEEIDRINSVMFSLRINEVLQSRICKFKRLISIVDYYNSIIDSRYNKRTDELDVLNTSLRQIVALYQAEAALVNYGLESQDNYGLYFDLIPHMKIENFQAKDIILKQGDINNDVYFIIDGMVEVIMEKVDYEFYDLAATRKILIL